MCTRHNPLLQLKHLVELFDCTWGLECFSTDFISVTFSLLSDLCVVVISKPSHLTCAQDTWPTGHCDAVTLMQVAITARDEGRADPRRGIG